MRLNIKEKSCDYKINNSIINKHTNQVTLKIPLLQFHYFRNSRKEVFQPHLPVRLPCYDLAPVTSFTLGSSLRSPTSGTPSFHGLTGGVYKARERIHRIMADMRLLAIPASRSRVADYDPNWDRVCRFAPSHEVAALCPYHCSTCVAQDVRAVMIWRHPHLPHGLHRQSH
jgi:hypothetical protein